MPSGACADSLDCQTGEFCDRATGCLPKPGTFQCNFTSDFDAIEVSTKWSFDTDQVISAPLIADVDGDGKPEVIINTYYAGGALEFYAEIIILDGETGTEQLRIPHDPAMGSYGSYSRASIGVGDVDGDSVADIVYVGRPQTGIAPFANNSSLIHAVNGQGQRLWTSHAPDGSDYFIYVRNGAPLLVNLDADPEPEIVFGTAILDNDGTLVFDQDNSLLRGGGVFGSNGDFLGGIATAADLDGDGYPEIISGRQAWSVNWTPGVTPTVTVNLFWEHSGPDGFPAVADLDGDGAPEVVVVGDPDPIGPVHDGVVYVLDGATGKLWCGIDPTGAMCDANDALRTQPIPIPGGGRGGPPVIADFDGDGRPEIAVAGGSNFVVFDLYRAGETVVQPDGDAMPDPGEIYVRWRQPSQDQSSSVTGATAFDFQGDGAVEVVYADECYVRVYSGNDGAVMLELENSSETFHEYPLVADVDGDGRSELVVVANDASAGANCGTIPGYTARRGVTVYQDVNDRFVPTRSTWTSHTYHITDATASGLTPTALVDHWASPETNAFRQNLGFLNAPDLTVELASSHAMCAAGDLEILASVRNGGALTIPSGIAVSLYRGGDSTGELVGTQVTATPLRPGEQLSLTWIDSARQSQSYFVEVDGDQRVPECVETNNGTAATLGCP